MTIASMYDLITMVKDMGDRDNNGNKPYVNDWVFNEDGRSIWILLSNGNEYTFSM